MELAWEQLTEERLRTGYRRVLRRTYKLPDGRVETFDIKDEGESVCILALTADNRAVLVRQFRPGPGKMVLDLPGGAIDSGESALEAAARELLEETGYTGDLREVGTCLECAYSTKIRHNFVATNCQRVQTPTPDDNEFLEVLELTMDAFRALLRSGQLTVVETGYMGLDHLGLI